MKMMGSKRWVCADVHPVAHDDMFVMKTKITFTGPSLMGYILLVRRFHVYIANLKQETNQTVVRFKETHLSIQQKDHNNKTAKTNVICRSRKEIYICIEESTTTFDIFKSNIQDSFLQCKRWIIVQFKEFIVKQKPVAGHFGDSQTVKKVSNSSITMKLWVLPEKHRLQPIPNLIVQELPLGLFLSWIESAYF